MLQGGVVNATHKCWLQCWEESSKGAGFARAAATFSVALIMIMIMWYQRRERLRLSLPPGPRGLPLLGCLPLLGPNPHQFFAELAQTFGPILSLRLGTQLYVIVSSPDIASEVYRDNDVIFSNHDQPVAAMIMSYGGSSLVRCPYGPTWRMLRRVLHHELQSNRSLEATYHIRRRVVRRMVHEIYAKNGTPINVGKLAYDTFLNLLTSMVWGGTFSQDDEEEAIGAEFRQLVSETVEVLTRPNISDYLPALAWFDVQGIERRMRKCASRLDRVYESLIEERVRKQTTVKSTDMLSILLKIRDGADPTMPLLNNSLKSLITDVMVGGTSTMSTTAEWVMAELMHEPRIMRRAQEELAAAVGTDTAVKERHVPRLHYLRAVVKETLRAHAVSPLLVPRVPSRDCAVAGYTIPAGARVVTNVWAIHRDPHVWEDPLQFRPERFLGDGRDGFDFFPFGSGKRKCAGLPLVERVLPLVTATLLHLFEWRAPEGAEIDLTERFGVTLAKAKPLILIPKPRLSNPELYMAD